MGTITDRSEKTIHNAFSTQREKSIKFANELELSNFTFQLFSECVSFKYDDSKVSYKLSWQNEMFSSTVLNVFNFSV